MIVEAFDNRKADKGVVKFLTSELKDPHIIAAINEIAAHVPIKDILSEFTMKNLGRADENEVKLLNDILVSAKHEKDPAKVIVKLIEFDVEKLKSFEKKAPRLFETAARNAVESTVFNLFSDHDIPVKNAPKFTVPVFWKLVSYIKIEHDEFFPLRSFADSKYLHNPVFIMSPDPKYPQFDGIDTAAATPKGEFIFSKHFCQKLLDYAHIRGIKAKGKKYESNGGDIPDEWAYIEFLIIHEFMHYTQADFHYGKIFKESPKVLNYVGDLRTNYLLVKSGQTQLPIGLYSDDINYDRQETYEDMIAIVKEELKKLSDQELNDFDAAVQGDQHTDADADAEEGEGAGSGTPKDVDQAAQDAAGKMSRSKDVGKEEKTEKEKQDAATEKANSSAKSSGGKQGKDTMGGGFDYKNVKPTYSWSAIVRKLVTSVANSTEDTYQKINKKTITSSHIAQQTGFGVVKPGEITIEHSSVALVVDSSGSMMDVNAKIYSNFNALMSKNSGVAAKYTILKFSNDVNYYICDAKKKKYDQVEKIIGKSPVISSGHTDKLFNETAGASTNFSGKLVDAISHLLKNKTNVLLCSDTDILDGHNLANLKSLLNTAGANVHLFIIFDSHHSYIAALKALGALSKNISYFKE